MLSPAGQQLLDALTGYGQARGWSRETLRRARRSLTAVLASGHHLGPPPWDAGEVRRFLTSRHLIALRAGEFLADEGLVRGPDDAVPDRWLAAQLASLPAPIAAEVRIWTDALQGRGPRPAQPHDPLTIQGYLRVLHAPLASWAARYQSLRQVTTDDLTSQLAPLTGATRLLTLSVMRSLFKALKARRVLFTNPAAPLTGRALHPPPVLPLDPGRRASLLSRLHEPADRLIVLLTGVHALRPAQICALSLDAVGTAAAALTIDGQIRPLDQLTCEHLHAWLHARRARWPATANPYLLINRTTAGGVQPVSRNYIQNLTGRAGVTARELRADRLLSEADASGGDPLILTRLFGISDPTAIRYCAETGALDQATR